MFFPVCFWVTVYQTGSVLKLFCAFPPNKRGFQSGKIGSPPAIKIAGLEQHRGAEGAELLELSMIVPLSNEMTLHCTTLSVRLNIKQREMRPARENESSGSVSIAAKTEQNIKS